MKEEIKEGYKKTEIGEIPKEWEVKRLGDVIKLCTNGISDRQNLQNKGIKVTRIETISEGIINEDKVGWVNTKKDLSNYKLKVGDILLSNINSVSHIGKVAYVDKENDLYHGMNLLRIQSNEDIILPKFLFICLSSYRMKKWFERNCKKAINQASLSQSDIKRAYIQIPPLKEQQKIASILSTVDEHIEQTDKLIEKTKELKKGLMQKIFSQEIRLKNENGENYPNWEEKRLGDCITHFGGKALEKYVSNEGTYKFISIGNYSRDGKYIDNNQRILLNEKTKDKLLNKNDLVMILNDKTLTGDIIGATILIDEDNKYIYNQRSERIICNNNILPKYMWLMLNSESFRKKVFSISQGGTQIYVNFSNVKKLIVKIPSLKEQQKIASILSEVDNQIEEYELKKEKLKTLKKGLMQQLLTGKIRVKV